MNLSHIFVLTSTRVFWVEVTASGEHDHARNHGAKIILSTRHFRDTTDNTLKLSILSDDMGIALGLNYMACNANLV